MEKVLVLIKPDAMDKKIVGEIITMYEKKDLEMVGLKMLKPTVEMASEHYGEFKEKPFFGELIEFITSRSLGAIVLEGESAISKVRKMHGATDPLTAEMGSVRAMYAESKSKNCVHASDSDANANREIRIWFPELVA